MNEFKYMISVVIPVYNGERWLGTALESVFSQSVSADSVQVIVVDDGSTDGTYENCLAFQKKYENRNILVRRISHAGVSAARNAGIKCAEGKYIMFLDADDMLYENTINLFITFFEMHYEEIDVVFPHVVRIADNGTVTAEPQIYKKTLENTGVYNLNDANIFLDYVLPCVKNKGDETTLFDNELYWSEDKLYFYQAILPKMKVGYLKEAHYYKVSRSDSYKEGLRTDKLLSEQILLAAEKMLELCQENIPKACQTAIVHMFNDHVMKDDSFWPHHYDKEKYTKFESRVKAVMSKIDSEVILNHPSLDKYKKTYWIKNKPNADMQFTFEDKLIEILADGHMLERRKDVEWTLRRIRSNGDRVTIFGDFKLAAFDFLDENTEIKFLAKYNDKQIEQIRVKPSFSGYCGNSRMPINKMWGFQLTIPANKIKKAELFVEIRGKRYVALIVNCANTVFNHTNNLKIATVGNVLVSQIQKRILEFKVLDTAALLEQRLAITNLFAGDSYTCDIRNSCNEYLGRNIWMYNDNFAMIDNGFFQFSHDVMINDGIERYYVVKNPEAEEIKNASEHIKNHLVTYGSREHILLFLNAKKIFTAFTSGLEWRPIQHNEMYKYWDIFNGEIILLSHGALNQYWPWSFSPIRMPVDKVVISTYYEYKAWSVNGFWEKDLIPSGMPRYAEFRKTAAEKPKRKILMALSWRMYLAGKHEILLDAATPRVALNDKYVNSSYFQNFMKFINSPELEKVLEENNVELDINLHPQFNLIYRAHMNITNKHVHVTEGQAELSEYMMMISDVSSIMFDFAIYHRPIMYFVPDIVEFKAGRNHFREVIIPFENGVGPYANTAEDAVKELEKIVKNDFKMEPKYEHRLAYFHVPLDDCCGKLYRYCIEEDNIDDDTKLTGSTGDTIAPYMRAMRQVQNGRLTPFLKCVYDYQGIPYNKTLLCEVDRNETDVHEYFGNIKGKNRYVVCMAVSDCASVHWKKFVEKADIGIKSAVAWRQGYVAMIDNGNIFEHNESTSLAYETIIKETNTKVFLKSRYYDQNEYPRAYAIIVINGINYSMSKRGINVVIFDKEKDCVCDSFNIDLYGDPELKINRVDWNG